VRGGLWRARTRRARPIAVDETVRVVAIDGVVLEVEAVTTDALTGEGPSLS
jgi:membrane protein implicated in regulation of membrane protease activity